MYKSSVRNVRKVKSALLACAFESLESRQLLSGDGALINTPLNGAYTPAQVTKAYGVSALANQGQGVTIGIVDEFDDTKITADTNAFSSEYSLPLMDGLSGDPTLTVVKDTALGTVGSAAGTGVGGETSLDVEWAHAMAPKANILLVEVPASGSVANEFVELLHGVQLAAGTAGVVSVSLSYGYSESGIGASAVVSQNSTYLATGAAANVAVTVSTGDSSSPSFPATSPNVIAVGGTSLYLSSLKGSYSFETGWGGLAGAGAGGGGLSSNFASPTFQTANGVSYAKRAIPDVSLVADPVTAVSIYDSLDSSTAPWTSTGGTSVASPIFAGIVALAQQNRLSAGLGALNSVQIDSAMYSLYNSSLYSTYFHDITTGNNKEVSSSGTTQVTGFSAATGYDEATGIGSPIANSLVSYLSTYIPTPSSTIRLGGIGTVAGRATQTVTNTVNADDGSTSLFDLLPVNGAKTITPAFVRAVAQAQQSPVVGADPTTNEIELSTANYSVYHVISMVAAEQGGVQSGYDVQPDGSASASIINDLGLNSDQLDAISGSIVSAFE